MLGQKLTVCPFFSHRMHSIPAPLNNFLIFTFCPVCASNLDSKSMRDFFAIGGPMKRTYSCILILPVMQKTQQNLQFTCPVNTTNHPYAGSYIRKTILIAMLEKNSPISLQKPFAASSAFFLLCCSLNSGCSVKHPSM